MIGFKIVFYRELPVGLKVKCDRPVVFWYPQMVRTGFAPEI